MAVGRKPALGEFGDAFEDFEPVAFACTVADDVVDGGRRVECRLMSLVALNYSVDLALLTFTRCGR